MSRDSQSYHRDRDYAILSRRSVFESEIKSLRHLMDGGCTRIWPCLSDSKGEYSDKKTVRFVGQIAEEKQYQQMHERQYDRYARRIPFYRDLLYCVLRTLAAGYTDYRSGVDYGAADRVLFADLTDAFEGNFGGLLDWNCVFQMGRLYKLLTGEKIDICRLNPGPEEMTDEMLKEEMAETGEEMLTEEMTYEESYRAMEEELGERLGYDMEEIRKEEEREEWILETKQTGENERIRAAFPAKKRFCRSVKEILLYLEGNAIDAGELEAEMKELIFQFLSDRRLSVFDEEEAYIEVMVQLKRTIRKAILAAAVYEIDGIDGCGSGCGGGLRYQRIFL